jgi:hypothetical protein
LALNIYVWRWTHIWTRYVTFGSIVCCGISGQSSDA